MILTPTLTLHNIELLVHKHGVTLDVVQSLPDDICLVKEPLVRHQQIQDSILFTHRGEVVVTEEDRQLPLLHDGVKLADTVVGQLTGGVVQELLRQQGLGHLLGVLRGPAGDDGLHHLVVGLVADGNHHLLQLGVQQPSMIEANTHQVKYNTLRSVLKVLHCTKPGI